MCGCSCPRSYRRNQVGDIFFQHSNPNCPGNPKIHGLFGVAWTEGNDSKLSCDLQYTSDDQEINTNFEKISKCVKNDKPKCSNCQCSECVCDKSQCVCDTSQCVCETSPCLCNKRRCTCSCCVPLEPVDSLQLTPKRREKRPEYVPKRPSQQNLEAETKPGRQLCTKTKNNPRGDCVVMPRCCVCGNSHCWRVKCMYPVEPETCIEKKTLRRKISFASVKSFGSEGSSVYEETNARSRSPSPARPCLIKTCASKNSLKNRVINWVDQAKSSFGSVSSLVTAYSSRKCLCCNCCKCPLKKTIWNRLLPVVFLLCALWLIWFINDNLTFYRGTSCVRKFRFY